MRSVSDEDCCDYKVRIDGRYKCGEPLSNIEWRTSAFGFGRMKDLSICDLARTLILTDEQKEVAKASFPNVPDKQAYKLYSRNMSISEHLYIILRRLTGRQTAKEAHND